MGPGYTRRELKRLMLAIGGTGLCAALWMATLDGAAAQGSNDLAVDEATVGPVEAAGVGAGEHVATERACYVRLPDLPSGRYGGFGAYNARTGVLTYAGGAEKLADDITLTHPDLYALRLDGAAADWSTHAYANNVGYARGQDRGCREMASVRLADDMWASVFGKKGCDNGRFSDDDEDGGDIKLLQVGRSATRADVRWVPNSGLEQLVGPLREEEGKLMRPFAVFDTQRQRIVLGQGTFDSSLVQATRGELYAASVIGSKLSLKQLRPLGERTPGPRYGACAAYVHQPEAGVDAVVLVGGRQGEESHADAWWLDFASGADGTWTELTPRIANMADYGARREGACAYDPSTRAFYSWMGRVDSDIPEGRSRSSGAWRLDLSALGDPSSALRWERLAPDNLKAVAGRHLIPSVWDSAQRRMFALGGRSSAEARRDVWAIYPDVTGAECAALDPNDVFGGAGGDPRPVPTPTAEPGASDAGSPGVCPGLASKVPTAVIAAAVANPERVHGYGQLEFPSLPPGYNNPRRMSLTLRNQGLAWQLVHNPLVYRAGCS